MKNPKKFYRWWDLAAVLLLLAAFLTAATRLVSTGWTRHLDITQIIVFFGVVLGTALGCSKFSPRISFLFALLYGLFLVPWQLGSIMKDEILWPERLLILYNRSFIIINQILRQEVVLDSLLFLIIMAVLFWLLSVYAGYSLTRYGRAWLAILPVGLVILVIHSFDSMVARRAWYLAAFIFFGLLLVSRMVFVHIQADWKKSRTALPPHLGLEFIRIAVVATALVVILVWAVPALAGSVRAVEKAWQPVRDTWNISQDYFDNIFASLQSSVGIIPDYYGKSAVLGRGNPLDDTVIFVVKSAGELPEDFRLYWRARNYDKYENGGWSTTHSRTRIVSPEDTDLQFTYGFRRMKRTFEFITASHMTTLFSPNDPLWVSRKSLVELNQNQAGMTDVSSLRASPNLEAGQAYRLQASLSYVSEQQLRNAGTEYPDWILERYLQIPDSITPRTIELAREITAGIQDPYDKAIAVTRYLRNNIEYTDTVPEQPQDQEAVDWMLFDLKQGFCNYYASAQVIMLRAVGIPARFSIGYSQGESLNEGEFLILQRHAHAWPEVFFPDIGWIEFEPTVSQEILVRPTIIASDSDNSSMQPQSEFEEPRPDRTPPDNNSPLQDQQVEDSIDINRIITLYLLPTAAFFGVLLLLLLIWRYRYRIDLSPIPIFLEKSIVKIGFQPPESIKHWSRHASLPPLSKAYQEINNALFRIGVPPARSFTPGERAELLGTSLPSTKSAADELVSEYQTGIFSQESGDIETAQQAGAAIKSISYKVYFQKLIDKIQIRRRKKPTPFKDK